MQQPQQPQQEFTLTGLTGSDVEIIMNSLNEQPAKLTRTTMNKIEAQIVHQVIEAQKGKPDDGKKEA